MLHLAPQRSAAIIKLGLPICLGVMDSRFGQAGTQHLVELCPHIAGEYLVRVVEQSFWPTMEPHGAHE